MKYLSAALFSSAAILAAIFAGDQAAIAQQDISPAHKKFFESKIRPVLIAHCYECHSIDSGMTRGGLLVDTRDGLFQGGESGAAIDLESIEDSPLWTAINYEDYEMPPGERLPDNVIADFKKWLEMGAPDPRIREKIVVETTIDVDSGRSHWAFQKPMGDVAESLDSLVNQKREATGTKPVDSADPATLLRRAYFDLIGLPPAVGEIQEFAKRWKADPKQAFEKTVDDLLARDQFGERWGRHWMDVARYAESTGNGNFTYPHAWRYRDFVIDAFNRDTPYDTFIEQQIAGDLMPAKTDEIWQENLIATGFLAIGIKDLGERNPRVYEMELIDEQIDTTTQAFLGLTVSCARCHDHKFDPIPTVDYYKMAGIFKSTQTLYGTTFGQQNHQSSKLLELPIPDEKSANKEFSAQEVEAIKKRIEDIQQQVRDIRTAQRAGGPAPEQRTMVQLRNQIGRYQGMLKTVDENGKPFTYGMGVQDGEVVDAHVLLAGEVEQKAQVVERGFLQILDSVPSKEIKSKSSGRRELAHWINSKENPLTARVMVNRVWMHLIGAPLMDSPNNWGLSSLPPANPELLDNLAIKFMANDWSVKKLIREIVLSQTYQRASTFDKSNFKIDPENKSLWRANPRQLDAESLRDAMLAISSLLKTERPLGSEVAAIGDAKIGRVFDKNSFKKLNVHRSVYLPIVRDSVPDSLALFDFADPNATQAQREATNVPSQSLYLMNNDYVTYLSQHMAVELSKQHQSTIDQVRHAFLAAYGRVATNEEIELSREFFKQYSPVAVALPGNAASEESSRRPGYRRGKRGSSGQGFNRGKRDGAQAEPASNRLHFVSKSSVQEKGKKEQQGADGGTAKTSKRRMGMQRMLGTDRVQAFKARMQEKQQLPSLKLTKEQQVLAAFCQSLMASAEFRILN